MYYNKFMENNLKNLRIKSGKTQQEIAQYLNITQSGYGKYELGKRDIPTDIQKKLAKFYNVSIDTLLSNNNHIPPNEEIILFPIVATIQAGYNKNANEEYTGEKLPIPKFMIHGDPNNYFVIQINGDSMAPRYLQGDRVLMERADLVNSGQTAAVCIGDEEATLKRVIYDENRTFITLEPLNENYSPRTFRGEDMNQIHIVGAVKQLIREVY